MHNSAPPQVVYWTAVAKTFAHFIIATAHAPRHFQDSNRDTYNTDDNELTVTGCCHGVLHKLVALLF